MTTEAPESSVNSLGHFSVNTGEFVSQLYISVPIGLILIFLYMIVRQISLRTWEVRRKYAEILVEEEMGDETDSDDPFAETEEFKLPKFSTTITYPRISTGFFFWMYDIWTMDTNTFYKHAGFDALVFRLYLKGCMFICLASLPYALCVLLPVYATSENVHNMDDPLAIISINSVGESSNRLYAAVLGCYIFTFIALYYLSRVYLAVAYATDQFLIGSNRLLEVDKLSWFNYKEMIDDIVDVNVRVARAPIELTKNYLSKVKRLVDKEQHVRQPSQELVAPIENEEDDIKYEPKSDEEKTELLSDDGYNSDTVRIIKNSVPSIDRYTIMIRDLPKPFRDETTLRQFMNRLFPNKIAVVVIVVDVRDLTKVQNEIKFHVKALKTLSVKHEFELDNLYDDGKLPTIYEGTKCCGCCGEQINLITYHRTNKEALMSRFNKMKKEGLRATPTAFVTFNCLKAASIAISCPIRFGVSNLKIQKAPYPNDLYWDNLKYSSNDLIPYNLLVAIAMFFLLIFWSIPVAAIQGLANLETIFDAFDANIEDYFNETTVSWMQGSLTVLILDLWLAIIPIIVELLTKLQRKTHRGRLEMLVMTKYFDCLVFMVLLVTVITGTTVSNAATFTDYAHNILASMSTIVDSLAAGLSNMSVFFLLYVLLNTFIWLPLELYRPVYHFRKHFNVAEPNRFNYSLWFAKTMLILVIVLTYAVMSPIMWLFGFIYFFFATFVFTYNLSMSWVPEFETGAKQWPLVFGRIRFGFMIAIFTLVGLMALKQAYICGALLVPLAGFIWYITGSISMKFRPVFNAPSLTSATEKDKQINKVINKSDKSNQIQQFGSRKELNNAYLPPIMCVQYPSYEERIKKRDKKGKRKRKEEENEEQRLSFDGVQNDADNDEENQAEQNVIVSEYDSYQNS